MPQPNSHHTIIFDLGNVLIRWDPRNLYRKLYGADVEGMEWFLSNVCNAEWNERLDAGHTFAAGVAERSALFPDHVPHIRAYSDRWLETLGDPIEENVAVLADLRERGYPLYALTNWSAETFPTARKLFPFLEWFKGIVVSGEERLIKPDARLYRVLLERYGVDPKKAVFIDDSHKNIEAARLLGISAVHFGPGVDLRAELKKLQVAL